MFKKNPQGNNEVLDGEDFYVSYNSNPGADFLLFNGDNGSDETALIKPDDRGNKYRILNGDFRKGYEKLVPLGFQACLEFYEMMVERNFDSSWSTHQAADLFKEGQ